MRQTWRGALIGFAALICSTCDDAAISTAGAEAPSGATAETAAAPFALAAGPGGLAGFLDCLHQEGVTLVSAHRGGSARGYPENAIETFERTLSSGHALLEIDVRATADGVLVLLHDEELDRGTTCNGLVENTSWSELSACRLTDYRGGQTRFTVPRLDEVLAWSAGRTILQLDVKELSLMENVVDAVRAAGAVDRVILIAYTPRAVERMARLDRRIMISASIDRIGDLDQLQDAGVGVSRLVAWTGNRSPDAALFSALSRRGVPVIFGTLGGRDSIDREIEQTGDDGRYREIAEMGVDIIGSDRADRARRALERDQDTAAAVATCRGG